MRTDFGDRAAIVVKITLFYHSIAVSGKMWLSVDFTTIPSKQNVQVKT